MDDVPPAPASPPASIAAACERLRDEPGVVVAQEIAQDANKPDQWRFQCRLKWCEEPPAGFPAEAVMEIVMPETYPFDAPEFFPLDDAFRGFPHQSSATGKLCLRDERFAPFNVEKLQCYIEWARGWLRDAATGELQKTGAHYELPDFRLEVVPSLHKSLPTPRLEFIEDAATFGRWSVKMRTHGRLWLGGDEKRRLVPLRYCDEEGKTLIETSFTGQKHDDDFSAHWILLPELNFVRHRPPISHGELAQLCQRHGLDYWQILRVAWGGALAKSNVGLLVWGMAVPSVFGGEPVEVHWQQQYFVPFAVMQRRAKNRKANQLWAVVRQTEFSDTELVHWGSSENIAESRCLARGSLEADWREKRIAILGCGALGSTLAEHLARGGVRDLRLFDKDTLGFGNLARHTLDGRSVGYTKASSLAVRLSSLHPQRKVTGHGVEIPSGVTGRLADSPAARALDESDWWFDAALDRSGFEWLSREARRKKKRLAALFLSWGAEYLTVLVSGRNTECRRVEQCMTEDIHTGRTPIDPARYFREPESGERVIPGAGCWHATFPASWPQVSSLAGAAMDLLQRHFAEPPACDGYAAVLRRTPVASSKIATPLTLVELTWAAHYR